MLNKPLKIGSKDLPKICRSVENLPNLVTLHVTASGMAENIFLFIEKGLAQLSEP